RIRCSTLQSRYDATYPQLVHAQLIRPGLRLDVSGVAYGGDNPTIRERRVRREAQRGRVRGEHDADGVGRQPHDVAGPTWTGSDVVASSDERCQYQQRDGVPMVRGAADHDRAPSKGPPAFCSARNRRTPARTG